VARLFIAVWPPAAVIEELTALPRPEEPTVRWTTATQWHVTLRFLGSVDVEDAAAGLARMRAAPAVAALGPRIVALGDAAVVPVAGLEGVAEAVRAATVDAVPDDGRDFRGHLTLARRRRPGPTPLLGHRVETSFVVDEVALVQSELHRDGARYRTVAVRALSPGSDENA
jgi:RNA 2',3'-cyclic 3'-phosphodiesterase